MTSKILASGLFSTLLLGCGIADDRAAGPQSLKSILSETGLTSESVNANLSDAMDALVDANTVQGSSASLALLSERDASSRNKTCVTDGDKAIVTLDSNIDRGMSHSGKRVSIEAERTGKSKIVRTWSKEGAAVACKDGKRADIDMSSDLTGLKLDVDFERSFSRSLSLTKTAHPSAKPNASGSSGSGSSSTIKKSVSMTAEGTRQVQWTAHTVNSDGSITRSKTIVSSTTRTHKKLDKSGQEQSMTFALEISQEAPLKVQVTYADASKERKILSKTIESGTITSTRSGDGKIVSSFSNLKLNMSSDDCTPESGSMKSEIYAEGASEPSKIYELAVSEGDYIFRDVTDPSNPVEVEDTEFEMCDIADHKD